jgi:hypothetical protein
MEFMVDDFSGDRGCGWRFRTKSATDSDLYLLSTLKVEIADLSKTHNEQAESISPLRWARAATGSAVSGKAV